MQKNNLKSIMRFKVETNKEPAPAIVFENNTINLLSKLNSSIDLDLYIYDWYKSPITENERMYKTATNLKPYKHRTINKMFKI